MMNNENKNELYLLVDIDDLLVRSSDKLQATLNEKTNFKTDVLRMLEQLNRNCRYFLMQVKKECETAKSEGRKPYLHKFPVFDNWELSDNNECYVKPVFACEYYLEIASRLLEQFLEERDCFLEIDNMTCGEIKTFDYQKEMQSIVDYANIIANNKDAFHQINVYCLREITGIINKAKEKNTINSLSVPEYGALVSMDTNDIIKGNSINSKDSKEYLLYQKPIADILNTINLENNLYDIIANGKVFVTPSEEIVDYNDIHSSKNVNWDAVMLVEKLINAKIFKGVYFSTHHNGSREEQAKIKLMQQILPLANGFIGQRFHDTEHNAVRRGRSSKIDKACEYLMISPEQIVLLDDSKANCGDCNKKGGTEILYKPTTDSELIKGKLEDTGYNRILDFNSGHIDEFIASAYNKPKRKVLK